MKRLVLPIAIAAGSLLAQSPQIVEEKQIRVFAAPAPQGPGAGAFTWMSAETSFEATLVKGVPFTGEFVTETSQTLADGNRIKSTNTPFYAWDGDGRTRREITVNMLGALTGNSAHQTIFINDPVAKVDYILDPQAKTARKIMVGTMMPDGGAGKSLRRELMVHSTDGPKAGSTVVIERRMEDGKEVTVNHVGPGGGATMERMPLPPGIVMQGETSAVVRQGMAIATSGSIAAAGNTNYKSEQLGKRIIEGVEAEGTRTTLRIPAGQIGNERALDTVSERWYSNELKTVVLTTRTDPRTGESTYKLTNLRRGEPSRYLFELPADYKVLTEDNAGPNIFRMRPDKKQE